MGIAPLHAILRTTFQAGAQLGPVPVWHPQQALATSAPTRIRSTRAAFSGTARPGRGGAGRARSGSPAATVIAARCDSPDGRNESAPRTPPIR